MSEPKGTYEATIDGETVTVQVRRAGRDACGHDPRYFVRIGDGPEIEVEALRPEAGVLSLLVDGRSVEAGLVPFDEGFMVDVLGIPHEVEVIDPRRKALRTVGGDGGAVIKTQMPGRIVRVLVAEGAAVAKGDPVLVVEAMKMENELKAPKDGTVRRVLVQEGALVEARAVLIELE